MSFTKIERRTRPALFELRLNQFSNQSSVLITKDSHDFETSLINNITLKFYSLSVEFNNFGHISKRNRCSGMSTVLGIGFRNTVAR